MSANLKDKVIVITGGGSGIGAASAALFRKHGAQVVVVDRNAPDTPHELALVGDVGDEATVQSHARQVIDKYGRIDGLLTCAGFSMGNTVADTPLEDWQAVMRTNVTGTFLWARESVRAMRQTGGGSIVVIGSQLAFAGGRSNAAYLTSKGAIVSLARTMAVDHASDGVRVNVLVPGAIDTPLLTRGFGRAKDPDAARARSIARHPIGRLGKAEEMAKAALFLISDDASFTTGSCLMADGGWLAG